MTDPITQRILEHEPLARYTSWKIGGQARYFLDAATPDELRAALAWARARALRVHLLGGGSNTLVLDAGFPGLIVRYRAQGVRLEVEGDRARATLDAGAPTAGTVRRLTRQGWSGLQWAEGVPGTIGGALYGNAGCYGGDMAGSLRRAWLLVGDEVEEWPVERFGYGYRTSALKASRRPTTDDRRPVADEPVVSAVVAGRALVVTPIILAAEFVLVRGDLAALREEMERTAALRREKTPAGQSCGSVFKNPPGESAGRLVEAAGLKGAKVGGAAIAEKHANYIVNRGDATSDDALRLIELARGEVLRQFGVELELEVEIVGP